jgi:hypothetical protein
MMTKDESLEIMRQKGKADAIALQEQSASMTGTELNAADNHIPEFKEAIKVMNMMERKAGLTDGFVCKSSAGRVVRLLQKYDSNVWTSEPEELPAQWGFVWSDDPAKAKPFIAISTSPYQIGNCCIENDIIYRSKMANNIHAPSAYPDGWEIVK